LASPATRGKPAKLAPDCCAVTGNGLGYKNHLGIARAHGFSAVSAVTDAARHDGGQLGAMLDPDNTGSGV
jgi:hypothetical protein